MKFEIQKAVLESVLSKARSVLATKDLVPILKNFNVTASAGMLCVVATDLALSVVAKTGMVNCIEAGQAIFPGNKFIDIVKTCEESPVVVSVEDDVAVIVCAGATWNVSLQSFEAYPDIPDVGEVEVTYFAKELFHNALNKVKGAAAKEGVRPALQMVDILNGDVRASDGAMFRQVHVPELVGVSMQIPLGAVEDLVKLLRGTEAEKIGFGQTKDHLLFVIGEDVFIVTKNNVEYPDVEESLLGPARNNKQSLVVNREQLINGVRRVRVNADEDTKGVTLTLKQDYLSLSARDKRGNDANETIEAKYNSPSGTNDRSLTVNHITLVDALTVVDSLTVEFMLGVDTRQRKAPVFIEEGDTAVVLQTLKLAL